MGRGRLVIALLATIVAEVVVAVVAVVAYVVTERRWRVYHRRKGTT